MLEEGVPCPPCRAGMHRIGSRPVTGPTLLSYIKGRRETAPETMMCGDRKEFWTVQTYE